MFIAVLPWDGIDFERTVPLIKHHQSIDSSRKDWERWRSCFDCSVALQSHCGSHRSAHTLFCMKYCLTGISVCIRGVAAQKESFVQKVLPILKNTFSPLYGAKCYKDGGTLNSNLCWLGCSSKRLFWPLVSVSGYMVRLGEWSPQKKFSVIDP